LSEQRNLLRMNPQDLYSVRRGASLTHGSPMPRGLRGPNPRQLPQVTYPYRVARSLAGTGGIKGKVDPRTGREGPE
jgi:hypothetical protein